MKESSRWMQCTTCKAIVKLNATGTCLGCQGGFAGQLEEDRYLPIETKLPDSVAEQTNSWLDYNQKTLEEINRETEARLKKEEQDAIKERKRKEGHISEHKDGDGCGKTTEAGCCNSNERCGKEQKEKKKWWKKQREEMNE